RVIGDHAGERDVARRRRLGEGDQIGADAVILRAEPGAEPAEAGNHLVGEQKYSVLVDDALRLGPVAGGRNLDATRALNRLAGKGGDSLGTDREDFLLQRARGTKAERLLRLALLRLAVPIGIHDVAETLIDGIAVLVHMRHAAHRSGGDGRAVIGVL